MGKGLDWIITQEVIFDESGSPGITFVRKLLLDFFVIRNLDEIESALRRVLNRYETENQHLKFSEIGFVRRLFMSL